MYNTGTGPNVNVKNRIPSNLNTRESLCNTTKTNNINVPSSTLSGNFNLNQQTTDLLNIRPSTSGLTNKPTGENKRKSRGDTDSSSDESVCEIAPKKVSQNQALQNDTLACLNEVESNQEMQI